jgi:hypothetical protein
MAEVFVPADFQAPLEVRLGQYVLRPLSELYVEADLAAVNSSMDLIRQTRGGTWPSKPITLEEDREDLIEHHRQFKERLAFAYAILSEDAKVCAGSVYIYPPNHPFDDSDKSLMPANADATVSFWTSQQAYDEGFYPTLYSFVTAWLKKDWPFIRPYISNKAQLGDTK